MSAYDKQVNGSHYKTMAIQPGHYAFVNNFNVYQALTLRYLSRYKTKDGLEDLQKAIHCIELLIEEEYGDPHNNRTARDRQDHEDPQDGAVIDPAHPGLPGGYIEQWRELCATGEHRNLQHDEDRGTGGTDADTGTAGC